MIPTYLEQLIWEGKAEYKTQTFGFGEQFVKNINPKTFIIVLGFDFSPRCFAVNDAEPDNDRRFLLQQLILSNEKKSNAFIWKPYFNTIAKQTNNLFFSELIQSQDLYLVFEEQLSIYTFMTNLQNLVFTSDALPTANLLRPNITGGGTTQIVQVDEVRPATKYAPLQEYGQDLGFVRSDQRDLLVQQETGYTPIEADPSNYPFITLRYVECKFSKPQTLS